MLPATIAKLEDVSETDRTHYKPLASGGFYAEITGLEEGTNHPAVGELARAKKREVETASARTAEAAKLKADLEQARKELHDSLVGKVPQSNLEALDKSYQQKIADVEAASKQREGSLSASLREVLVDREARSLAGGIALDSNAAELLAESVQRRLTVEITSEGKAVTRVLGLDGKPSAASLDDLKKEILATPKYSALLSGSKASGSGASASGAVGGTSSAGKVDLAKRNPKEYAAEIASRL